MHERNDSFGGHANLNKTANRFMFGNYHETRHPQYDTHYSLGANRFGVYIDGFYVNYFLAS